MFFAENVKKCIALLDEAEQTRPGFSKEEKQAICRIALHQESFEEIEKMVLQLSAPQARVAERQEYLKQKAAEIQQPNDHSHIEIQNYIFQLQFMSHEMEKANQMLEQLLKRSDIQYDLDSLIADMQERQRNETPEREELRR